MNRKEARAEMVSKASALKLRLRLSYLSLFSLSLMLLIVNYASQIETQQKAAHPRNNVNQKYNQLDFLTKLFEGKKLMRVGLVNMEEEEESVGSIGWQELGNTTRVHFDRVPKELGWVDFFPEWIDEDHKFHEPKCLTIPMPRFEEYGAFDVVISRVPCGSNPKKGARDVLRLQVHLVVANLLLKSGLINGRQATLMFLGSCEPMWEIFCCEDLVAKHEDLWVFKPDLRRLKQKLLMPVGSCELATPFIKLDQGKAQYNVSRVEDTPEHPRLAYATVLHSSEDYVCGAIALAQSLIQTNTTHDLVLLADKSITNKSRLALTDAGWKVKHIDRIQSPQAKKNAYNEWNYSKLRIWQLTEYDKIVFIDADFIVVENLDRIFTMPQMSAVGNDGVLFNSGVMVIEPSTCVFEMLMNNRFRLVSYNGGDQGYLNEVFSWWHRLPTKLNRLKVFKRPGDDAKARDIRGAYAIHYLGFKPWMCYRDYDCNWDKKDHQIFASDSAHRRWWNVYDSLPKRLQASCALSRRTDRWLKRLRTRARDACLADGHWKMKIKDPRQLSPTKVVRKSYVGF